MARAPLATLVACVALAFGAPASFAVTLPPNFVDQPVTSLTQPIGIAFTPDQRLLITTEPGTLRIYKNGALLATPALDISAKVCSNGERGLLGVAVDPSFASNHYIYLYYTFKKFGVCDTSGANIPVNRVSRFVLGDNDIVDPASEVILVDNIPNLGSNHNAGDVHFGKDGFLYISVGDGGCDYAGNSGCGGANDASRDEFILLGKILRVTRDGEIPPTNPFQGAGTARCNVTGSTTPGNKCQETYAWGLRNPFRIAFDPNSPTTRFFINDVGQSLWEEIDLGQAGADYGWNVREGPCPNGQSMPCSAAPPGMTDPIHWYTHGSCNAITGGAFVPNEIWPRQYAGQYLYDDLVCGKIFVMPSTPGATAAEFGSGFGSNSLINMIFGPYGSTQALYYVTWNAPGYQVRRIAYTGYVHPAVATPTQVALVPAFTPCTSPDATHGTPLSSPACSNASQTSPWLTLGTAAQTNVKLRVFCNGTDPSVGPPSQIPGLQPPCTSLAGDQEDLSIEICAGGRCTFPSGPAPSGTTDVRCKQAGTSGPCAAAGQPYSGKILVKATLQITDELNTLDATDPSCESATDPTQGCAATTSPFTFEVGAQCSAGNCKYLTSADAVYPGANQEQRQAVWELSQLQVYDGGPDGDLAPAPAPASGTCPPACTGNGGESLFEDQGLFAP